MSEIAVNIERIYPDGVRAGEYVFAAHTVPPRFATVGISDNRFWVTGPLTQEQLDISLCPGDGGRLSEADQEICAANPVGYAIEIDDGMHAGNYPGGHDGMARNLARLALGA